MSAAVLLDPARLDRPDTEIRLEPFPFLIAHGQLPDESRTDLERDFPKYASAGFFPYDPSVRFCNRYPARFAAPPPADTAEDAAAPRADDSAGAARAA